MLRSAIAVMKFRPTKLLTTLSAFAAHRSRTSAAKMSLALGPASDRAKFLTVRTKRIPVVFSGMACAPMNYLWQIRCPCGRLFESTLPFGLRLARGQDGTDGRG